MENKIAILVKYLCPTNTLGSRVKLTLPRWENKSLTIPYNYSLNNVSEMAETYLIENGVIVESEAEVENGFILIINFSEVKNLLSLFKINA
jgi:hypothetical protein